MNAKTIRLSTKAKAVKGVVPVIGQWLLANEYGFITSCADYDEYSALPDATELEDRVYVKTGWNSDTCWAYYKTGQVIARAV